MNPIERQTSGVGKRKDAREQTIRSSSKGAVEGRISRAKTNISCRSVLHKLVKVKERRKHPVTFSLQLESIGVCFFLRPLEPKPIRSSISMSIPTPGVNVGQGSSEECSANQIQRPEAIRQRVEDRHWQLFEARLKKQLSVVNKENYTHANDYRVINRLTKPDQPQAPIEPARRWESFCSQLTSKSQETNRVLSIFHQVWLNNWNAKQMNERQRRRTSDPALNKSTLLNGLSINEHDRKVVATILHRPTSSEHLPANKIR